MYFERNLPMEQLTSLFKAVADRNRLRLVFALMQYPELCACQLTELIEVAGATASRHLSVLISSGWVASRKESRWVYYRLCLEKPALAQLVVWLQTQAEGDQTLANDTHRLARITTVDREDLCRQR